VQAFDVKTGKRVWHYQLVHHGLWDYDLPAPPVLATITWNGKPRDVVAVPSKTAWIYVFDREPVRPFGPLWSGPCRRAMCQASARRRRSPCPPTPRRSRGSR
jgi:quinoprotein glucose dehydrogenase